MRFALLALPLMLSPATAWAADPIAGNWRTQDGKAMVTIAPCGRELCGKVTRIFARDPKIPTTDVKNPNAALRDRPMLGLSILSGFTADTSDWRGTIYDPKSGRSYRSVLRRNPDGTLNVKGCISFICQGQTWMPVG